MKKKKKKLREFSKGQIQRNPIPRYIIIKFLKTDNREKILKAATEEQIRKIVNFLLLNSAQGSSVE